MEQDRAYEESLAIDRKKVGSSVQKWNPACDSCACGCLQALLRELRQQLEEKDYRNADEMGGVSVSIRFSNYRVDHRFSSTASVKVRCMHSLKSV
jgi:hypothetical protein